MNDPNRLTGGGDRGGEKAMTRRIEVLEREIQRWRCLTAAGFLTALGAFGLAVFGLSQLENTYFIGEMASAQMSMSPRIPLGDIEGVPAPEAGETNRSVFPPAMGLSETEPGMASRLGKTSPSVLTGVQGDPVAATDGGS